MIVTHVKCQLNTFTDHSSCQKVVPERQSFAQKMPKRSNHRTSWTIFIDFIEFRWKARCGRDAEPQSEQHVEMVKAEALRFYANGPSSDIQNKMKSKASKWCRYDTQMLHVLN